MWVRLLVGDVMRAGIVAAVDNDWAGPEGSAFLVAEVHIVDESGDTVVVLKGIPVVDLTQARVQHIPEPRKPDLAVARRLGYV